MDNWVIDANIKSSLTDTGNAYRFLELHGNDVRYNYSLKTWFIWDGKRWEPDITGKINILAENTAQDIYFQASKAESPESSIPISKWAKISLSKQRLGAMLELAKPHVSVRVDDLDESPMLLNLRNGIVDLKTGVLLPHDKEFLLTKIIDFDYEAVDCPKWRAFLDKVIPDKDLQEFLQKLVGYSITGETSEQILNMLYGTGANGKSTFVETLREIFGDYAQKTSIEALLEKRLVGGNTPYIARMKGARLLFASEIPNGKRLDEAKIKDLTGGDMIIATAKYQHPIEFKPTHKLWLVGNHKPPVKDTTHSYWRRIIIIPFIVTIAEDEQIPMNRLIEDFKEEASGILYWAVQGCLKWKEEGLNPPLAVKDATKQYRSEYDIFQQFLNEMTEPHPEYTEKKAKIFDTLTEWAENIGYREMVNKSKTWITRELTSRGFTIGGKNRSIVYGIRLKNMDWSEE